MTTNTAVQSRKMIMTPNARVLEAIKRTPQEYWKTLCATRAGKSAQVAGSCYPHFGVNDVEALILKLVWEPYNHVNVQAPAEAFIANDVPGRIGIIRLKDIDPKTQIILVDPKKTGYLEGVVVPGAQAIDKPKVDFTVIILGKTKDIDGEIVFTFHPGDPIPPSRVKPEDVRRAGLWVDPAVEIEEELPQGSAQAYITASEAIGLGMEWVKI